MIYGRFYSHDMQCDVIQITKPKAKKMYDAGKTVYLHPSNMTFSNVWQRPCPINKQDLETRYCEAPSFEHMLYDYQYYNCDPERGKYVRFFIKVEDLK